MYSNFGVRTPLEVMTAFREEGKKNKKEGKMRHRMLEQSRTGE